MVSRETTTEVKHQRQKSKDSDSSHMYVVGPLDTDMSGDTQLIKTDPFQQETLGTEGSEAVDGGFEMHKNTEID
jgi:hypothetical protein|tara:strand:- start:81 stop:302 length:222 start_codon:yes stop_codon:yes gene_type:complete